MHPRVRNSGQACACRAYRALNPSLAPAVQAGISVITKEGPGRILPAEGKAKHQQSKTLAAVEQLVRGLS